MCSQNNMKFRSDDFNIHEVYCTEPVSSPGGIQYDVLIAEPAKEAPKLSSPHKISVSTTDIEAKLKAAEKRRASLKAQRIHFFVERMRRLSEAQQKRKESNLIFKVKTRHSLEHKMESIKENREGYLKSIRERARKSAVKVEKIRRNHESDKYRRMMEKFNREMERARKLREANIEARKECLRLHVLHIADIKKQMDAVLGNKKERLMEKLAVATEKRRQVIQDIREKMREHARHISNAFRRQEQLDNIYLNSIGKVNENYPSDI